MLFVVVLLALWETHSSVVYRNKVSLFVICAMLNAYFVYIVCLDSVICMTFFGLIIEPPVVDVVSRNPCIPSICGPNSICKAIGETPVCSCLTGYIGRPPNCRPECTINADCPGNLACQNERCKNPCPASCGVNADCSVSQHSPICSCIVGYTGNPFVECSSIPICKLCSVVIVFFFYSSM
jgi:hypothetical protein